MRIIIATQNPGKLKEFRELFQGEDFTLESLADYPEIPEVEETGTSFSENARLKAETIAQQLQTLTIADDSGLQLPILNGAPGVHSARYSGEPKDDARNNQKLLQALANYPQEDRKASFVTALVVSYPGVASLCIEGEVEGYILEAPQGEAGFGYDPLFYYPPAEQTFAEMPLSYKNQISHRGQAFKQLKAVFRTWLKENQIQ